MKSKIFIILGLIFFVLLFLFLMINEPQVEIKSPATKEEIITNCQNLNVIHTSECLVKNIKTFFIYNKTNDNLQLTFEQLKERGGDCRDWAFLYEELGKDLGFYTYSFPVSKNETNAHRFAVISGDKGFCVINMIHKECFKF